MVDLADRVLRDPPLDVKLFIGGECVDAASGRTFESRGPATNQVIARVAEADAADVDRAVRAARRAFDEGPWPRIPVSERAAILLRMAQGIRDRLHDLARLETLDTGKPIRESISLDIPAPPTTSSISLS